MVTPPRRLAAFASALFALLLAACTPAPEGFRDLSAPFGATTRFDPVRFGGVWRIVASFEPVQEGPLTVTVSAEAIGLSVASSTVPEIAGFYDLGAPGELLPRLPARETLVVMWVDEDFLTAAIGTRSGSFGAILNRDETLPQDRGDAVRDILEFYGWDVSRLRGTYQ